MVCSGSGDSMLFSTLGVLVPALQEKRCRTDLASKGRA